MKNKGEISMDENRVETVDRNAEIADLFAEKTESIESNKKIDAEIALVKADLNQMEQKQGLNNKESR